jgi:hypothetical protein
MNDYKPASRPAAFGAIAVALTAMTIGLAVVLPAKMDTGGRDVQTIAIPEPAALPAADVDTGPIRIDVVAAREPTLMRVQSHLPVPKSSRQGSGHLGTRAVAAPEHLGADANLQRAACPYLSKGTVAATS